MKIAIGSDHAGFEYKGRIIEMLSSLDHEVRDFGTHSTSFAELSCAAPRSLQSS